MYTLPTSNYLQRSLQMNHPSQKIPKLAKPRNHINRVRDQLVAAGVSRLAFNSLEGKYLPFVIHEDEHIGGAVYGRCADGFAMLVATDRRVIYLDKKPFFVNEDEITYDVVSGVSLSSGGIGTTVSLHTRIKDFVMHSLNEVAARNFVEYIESNWLEQSFRARQLND